MTSSAALDVEPRLLGEGDALGERLDQTGDADLVEHLGELAAARAAHQRHGAAVVGEQRRGTFERRGVAADHDRELAVLGARLAARDRRIQKADAFGRRGRVNLARDLR